jgi:hypothetical protein
MNRQATGLIVAKLRDEPFLLSVFPKHPDIIKDLAEVSARSTAVGLAMMMPGALTTDPRLDALLVEALNRLPETDMLASTIEAEIVRNQHVLGHPSVPIAEALTTFFTAVAEGTSVKYLRLPYFPCVDPDLPSNDTNDDVFRDEDGRECDGLFVSADVEDDALNLDIANVLNRWSQLNLAGEFSALVPPRSFAIPGFRDILITVIKNTPGIFNGITDIVLAGDSQTLVDELNNIVLASVECGHRRATFELPGGSTVLEAWTLGYPNAGENWNDMLVPSGLTVLTEVLLPITSLILDFQESGWIDLDRAGSMSIGDYYTIRTAWDSLSSSYGDLVNAAWNQDSGAALMAIVDLASTLGTSESFWDGIGYFLDYAPDAWLRRFADGLGNIFNPFGLWDKVAQALSVIFTVGMFTANFTYDAHDAYAVTQTDDDDDSADDDTGDDTSDDTGDDDLVDHGDGTASDPVTGQMWQVAGSSSGMSWSSAQSYCRNLDLADHFDWRLPSITELRSIVRGCSATESDGSCGVTEDCAADDCWNSACNGCDDNEGPDGGCYWPSLLSGACVSFWSSTEVSDDTARAWYLGFSYGFIYYDTKSLNGRVRCVR